MCQKRTNFLFLRANVPTNASTCYTACQCFNLACQRAKWGANFSTWCANVPKGVLIFQTFLLRNLYTLSLYEKFYIILNIMVIHVIGICIVRKKWIILHFYTSCHIKEKCVDKKTWFLCVTRKNGFLEFSTTKTTNRKEYV